MIQSVFGIVMPNVARWRSFKLELPNFLAMEYVLQQFCECPAAPSLQRLKLEHWASHDKILEQSYQSLLTRQSGLTWFSGNTPVLKDVAIRRIPWSQCLLPSCLTSLELGNQPERFLPRHAEFTRILSTVDQLESLRLFGEGWNCWHAKPLQLHRLKHLAFIHIDSRRTQPRVECMIIPQLSELELGLYGNCTRLLRSFSAVHPLMSHSIFSTLESLILAGFRCDDDAVRQTYESLTELRTLRLNFLELSDAWCHALTGQPVVCRKLESLSAYRPEGPSLCNLVAWRNRAGFPLKLLRVGPVNSLSPREEEWLRRNVEQFEYYEDDEEVDNDGEGFVLLCFTAND